MTASEKKSTKKKIVSQYVIKSEMLHGTDNFDWRLIFFREAISTTIFIAAMACMGIQAYAIRKIDENWMSFHLVFYSLRIPQFIFSYRTKFNLIQSVTKIGGA